MNLTDARAVIEAEMCGEQWYAGDRWCRIHGGWFPEGEPWCDALPSGELLATARSLLVKVEAVEALRVELASRPTIQTTWGDLDNRLRAALSKGDE